MLHKHIVELTNNALKTITETLLKQQSGRDPLDGDEVDVIMKVLKLKLNLHEGNITQDEFNNRGGTLYE